MDGQNKVVNMSLGNRLRCLVGNFLKNWGLMLAQAKFAYNYSPNGSKGFSPFYVVYGMHPMGFFELIYLDGMEKRRVDG
jgi:hypothetical protein